jgi:hypothetical protein
MRIALFVNPTREEYAAAVETATFVSELAINSDDPLVLSCGVAAALDVSLAVMGRSVGRTVEGGERRPSPIVLLPIIRDRESPIDAALGVEPGGEQFGTLADLVDLGLIAGREETGIVPFGDRDPVQAFVDVLRDRRLSLVVGLGSRPEFWAPTLRQLREIRGGRLIVPPDISPRDLGADDPEIIRARSIPIPDRPSSAEGDPSMPMEDEFESYIVQARRCAALTAGVIEKLLEMY